MTLRTLARTLAAVVAGLLTWGAVATILHLPMKLAWPAYAAVIPSMSFSLPMMVARLALSAVATLAGGYVLVRIAPSSVAAPWILGALLLLIFVPSHVAIGPKLPLWYHLTFLSSLVPLTLLGARLAGWPRADAEANGVDRSVAR